MLRIIFFCFLLCFTAGLQAQRFEFGVETYTGIAYSTFKGNLPKMVGFSELEISKGQLDTAFANFNLDAPKWLRDLYPGIRIEVKGDVIKRVTRPVKTVRFFGRTAWFGGSFSISDPRLAEQPESQKFKNQFKAIRLSLSGKAEELALHLAVVAAADATKVKPFFSKRYDLEGFIDAKQILLGPDPFLEWGNKGNNSLDAELIGGVRFTADPSPVVDLGSVLFIRDKLDSLMEGGILSTVENLTDKIAEGLQNVIFGRFRDPRVVPSVGWYARPTLHARFGGRFSLGLGAELSLQQHTSIKGTNPMFSAYGFAGLKIDFIKQQSR